MTGPMDWKLSETCSEDAEHAVLVAGARRSLDELPTTPNARP